MATASPNTTVTATTSGTAQVLFDISNGDKAFSVYTVRNRDATNYVRVVVFPLHALADGGAAVGPGVTQPFAAPPQRITKVVVWTEAGTPIIDGFVNTV